MKFSEKTRFVKDCRKKIILGIIITSTLFIILSIAVGIYLHGNHEEDEPTTSNKHQLITRLKWGGRTPFYERPLAHPTTYVIISHTASQKCNNINDCSRLVAAFQSQHISEFNSPDVGYNFLIGGDENIYVGRGWDAENFHMADSIGISFIGNFIYDRFTPGMIEAAQDLLRDGLDSGKLNKNYKLISHNQTGNTLSPGQNVYESIRFWPHYTDEKVPIIS